MARTTRLKRTGAGVAYYHLMSQTNDKKFLFEKGKMKTALVDALKRAAAFSGIILEAYVGMNNHFHVVCKVVRGTDPISEDEILHRVAILKGERAAEELALRWKRFRSLGHDDMVEAEQKRLCDRMNDISEFMKTFKEVFNIRFKREREYTGSIWSGRFKSTLIEGGRYLEVCRRYVYLNPVRAGIVSRAADYEWSWIAPAPEPFNGDISGERRLLMRVVQVGEGKVFGSFEFVRDAAATMKKQLNVISVSVREVEELGYATHGWRLAKHQ